MRHVHLVHEVHATVAISRLLVDVLQPPTVVIIDCVLYLDCAWCTYKMNQELYLHCMHVVGFSLHVDVILIDKLINYSGLTKSAHISSFKTTDEKLVPTFVLDSFLHKATVNMAAQVVQQLAEKQTNRKLLKAANISILYSSLRSFVEQKYETFAGCSF